MPSKKEPAWGLPQLGLSLLLVVAAGMWLERQTEELWGRC